MKKLMIALAAVAMGVAANAASFAWQVPSGRIFDGTGTTGAAGYSPTVGMTAYLFDAGVYSQETLVSALSGAGADYTKAIAGASTVVNSDARVDAKSFTYSVTESFDAYFVIVGDDKVFISDAMASGIQASAEQAIDFASVSTPSKTTFTSGTFAANGAGWYSTAAVPEPTSGLLLLLGVAGLALKRKRA